MNKKTTSLLAGLAVAFPLALSAQFFSDDFSSDTSANWNINISGEAEVIFGFDYSVFGIPQAPNGSDTKGLYMRANWSLGAPSGVSVSPKGFSLPVGDFVLKFDVFNSFNGPLPGGGDGSTVNTSYGIGTAGDSPQWYGGTHDSLFFTSTGDGGGG